MEGNRLKKLRERLGISQTDFAIKIGESKQTLYKYEHNITTNVPSDKIELMAEILGCSPAYLMGWEETKEIPGHTETSTIYTPVMPEYDFNTEETEIIKAYRKSDSLTKAMVLRTLGLEDKQKRDIG